MHTTNTHSEAELDTGSPHRLRNRLAGIFTILLVVLVIAFIPPLINVGRYQHRIASNISASLGRTVTFDRVSLTLLPLPGFTLDNFVIAEDPAFGSEPILRADHVNVTLRISSLWGRRVEFSKISLTESTSVNLVRLPNGKWNIESLLLQASHIEAAPTAQRFASAAPRFPYIEATGARLNLKLDQEKTPFSLTDAEFALWLPEPHQWHLRLLAHPMRTDLSPGDTGTLRVEGTLGGNGSPAAQFANSLAQIPIDLHGQWQDAQLGDLSRLLSGSDAGLRGDFSMTFGLLGTIEYNTVTTDIKLANARRADFVPPSPLSLEAGCRAIASNTFHSFSSIECHWPPADSSDPSTLILAASLPDVSRPQSSSGQITFPALPADTFFNWLSVATPHPPTGLAGSGTLAGTVAWVPNPKSADFQSTWSGELELSGASLDLGSANHQPISLADVILRSTPRPVAPAHSRPKVAALSDLAPDSFDLLPISLDLGGKEPAILEGHLDATGYTLHLAGSVIPARLVSLGDAIPQLGEGLKDCLLQLALIPPAESTETPAMSRGGARGSVVLPNPAPDGAPVQDQPTHIDLTATRPWDSPQVWHPTAAPPTHPQTRARK
jgi:AsmA family